MMTKNEYNIEQIRELVTTPAILEQMAEECSELCQALLKKARRLRGENYTPMTLNEIDRNIIEEFTDVIVCANTLNLSIDNDLYFEKLQRWVNRNEDNK